MAAVHRQQPRDRRLAHLLLPEPEGPGDLDRHGLLLGAGGDASGLPGAAQRGDRHGAGRGRDAVSAAGSVPRHVRGGHVVPARPMQVVGQRRRRLRAGEGVARWCSSAWSDARAAGDPIHGVIIGSGINQDGKTNGITAPSGASQSELQRESTTATASIRLRSATWRCTAPAPSSAIRSSSMRWPLCSGRRARGATTARWAR